MRIMIRLATATAAMILVLTAPAFAADEPPGAASCSGCHATGPSAATPVPKLVNRDAAQIVTAMQQFRTGQLPATMMDRIAKGFTDDEVRAIATWYAAQKD